MQDTGEVEVDAALVRSGRPLYKCAEVGGAPEARYPASPLWRGRAAPIPAGWDCRVHSCTGAGGLVGAAAPWQPAPTHPATHLAPAP